MSVVCILFSLTACSSATGAETGKEEVWNVAVIQTENHPQTLAVVKMGEIFSELTDGRYRFEVYPNELLGPQRETLEQVQYGIIEMAVIGNSNISSFVEGFLTFEIPFVFDDQAHQQKFFETSDEVENLFKQTEKYNFKMATYFTAGTRNMYTSKPIHSVKDLKGMKIRTAESDTYAKMMKYLGGSATPMSMGEVFTAIQSGVVDGAENNEASYSNSKHYEIAPYYSYTKHLIVPDYLIVNTKLYNKLSEEDKKAFTEAARLAAEYEYNLWEEDAKKSLEKVIAGGATVIEDVDVASLKNAVQPLHDELCENPAIKEVYDAVKAVAK
ncbi:MAG: C4-dicarboxylate transporter substrate-binding protein [Clostridia bacterium]|nr:C4-dicarboxylate transporter substrate-binding protein [Clostridia bacterium]